MCDIINMYVRIHVHSLDVHIHTFTHTHTHSHTHRHTFLNTDAAIFGLNTLSMYMELQRMNWSDLAFLVRLRLQEVFGTD